MDKRLDGLLDDAIQRKNRRDFRGAARVLVAAVDTYPESGAAWYLLGGIYLFKLDQPEKARACFEKATALGPRSEHSSLGLFHALWDLDLRERAIAEMSRFQSVSHSADYDEIAAELRAKGEYPTAAAKDVRSRGPAP